MQKRENGENPLLPRNCKSRFRVKRNQSPSILSHYPYITDGKAAGPGKSGYLICISQALR